VTTHAPRSKMHFAERTPDVKDVVKKEPGA
jgi:hypothetical protein